MIQSVYSTIIVDKETSHIQALKELIADGCPDLKVISSHDNEREASREIMEYNPDLVFADLDMPLISGAALLHPAPRIDFDVIFTSDYDEGKLKKLDLNKTNLLLKPYTLEPLQLLVEKFRQGKAVSGRHRDSTFRSLFKNINGQPLRKISVTVRDSVVLLNTAEILYFTSDRNYTEIHLRGGRTLTAARTLGYFEKLLASNDFWRIHASCLVNSHEIAEYRKAENGELVMSDGRVIKVSRNRKGILSFLSG